MNLQTRSHVELGPVAGFDHLYRRHFGLVWSVLRAMGVPLEAREDVAQDVWMLIHRKRHLLRADASSRAWVASLARGVARRHHRTCFRRSRREAAYCNAQPQYDEGLALQFEAERHVARFLAPLNEEQRVVYTLVHGFGLTAREVAEVTGVGPNTVSSRLRLARRTLQAAVERDPDSRVRDERLGNCACPHTRERIRARVLLVVRGWRAAPVGAAKTTALVHTAWAKATWGVAAIVAVLCVSSGPSRSKAAQRHAYATPSAKPNVEPNLAAVGARVEPALASDVVRSLPPTRRARKANVDRRTSSPNVAVGLGAHGASSRRDPPTQKGAATHRLSDETSMLFRARQALEQDAPARAVRLLERHAQLFPMSSLADVREALRVESLCHQGRVAEGRSAAQRRMTVPAVAVAVARACVQKHPIN